MTVKTVTMTEGIPLVSKSGLRELILLLQQMRSPIFQIGVLYTCSNNPLLTNTLQIQMQLPLAFDVFQDISPRN